MNEIKPESSVSSLPGIPPTAAQKYLTQFMGHACELLGHIEDQNKEYFNESTFQRMSQIYEKAKEELNAIKEKLEDQLKSPELSKKDITNFAKQVKKAEKEIAKVIQKAQIAVAAEIGSGGNIELKEKIEILARGGWKASIIKLLALVMKTHAVAIQCFKIAQIRMEKASQKNIVRDANIPWTKIDEEKNAQFLAFRKGFIDLKNRAGVIGLNGVYRIATTFSDKTIRKQLKSYIAQNLSDRKRTNIEKEIEIPSYGPVKSLMVPLNEEFDERTNLGVAVFGSIFGEKGVSSLNRQEAHLVNAWESNLSMHDQPIYRTLRHAIASDKFETNVETRHANSVKAAEELLKAAVMQEIEELLKFRSWEDIMQNGIQLNLNSVSLVTPDDVRAIGSKGANEKNMLLDQVEALHIFEKTPLCKCLIGDKAVPVKVQVNTFNFGVNAGAVDWGFGTKNQYDQNVKAFQGLKKQVEALKIAPMALKDRTDLENLTKDIEHLMASSSAYLKGDNQFEIGAKIINLSNLMNKIKGSGYKCAFNCMSGKDRTGIMDAIAKAYAVMALGNGHYPTHEELQNNDAVRQQFREVVVPLLLGSGSLEITETNTGAKGYKVTKHALVGDISEEHFLDIIGLSKLASS